jgi:hypothetical protein
MCNLTLQFGVRTEGESKLDAGVIASYLKHLVTLYMHRYPIPLFFVTLLTIVIISDLVSAMTK